MNTQVANPTSSAPTGVDALFATLYPELRKLARSCLRGHARDACVNTTVLVHESYERLATRSGLAGVTQPQFFAYASRVMRSVLVDLARERLAAKRGGDVQVVTLVTGMESAASSDQPDLLRVHEAIDALSAIDARLAEVVELRYFGGLDYREIAAALGISVRTVEREWEKARSYLFAVLKPD